MTVDGRRASSRASGRARVALALAALVATTAATTGEARAEIRYLTHIDAREVWNSDIYAGVPFQKSSWDMITEIEPGLRFYLGVPRNLLYATYNLLFQVYARAQDPDAGRNLIGYANTLRLGYHYLIDRRTEFAITDRFYQGTENTMIRGEVNPAGGYAMGFFTTGSKYVADSLTFGLHHAFNERWSNSTLLTGEFYMPYGANLTYNGQYLPPPNTITATLGDLVTRAFTSSALYLATDFGYLLENRPLDYRDGNGHAVFAQFPQNLSSFIFGMLLGWRHELSPLWDYRLGAGFDVRAVQQYVNLEPRESYPPWINTTGFGTGISPAAEAAIRYRYEHYFVATLGYSHRTSFIPEAGVSTTAQTDEVGLAMYSILGHLRLDVEGAYRYIAVTSRVENAEDSSGMHEARALAALSYGILPGVSVEASYQFEAVKNRYNLAGVNSDSLAVQSAYTDYFRHLIMVGISLVWPPPPPQDVRLSRRESEFEPLFTLEGVGGATETRSTGASIDGSSDRYEQTGSTGPLMESATPAAGSGSAEGSSGGAAADSPESQGGASEGGESTEEKPKSEQVDSEGQAVDTELPIEKSGGGGAPSQDKKDESKPAPSKPPGKPKR
jgi:hypothetical protein